MSLEEYMENNRGLLVSILAAVIGLIVIASVLVILSVANDNEVSYVSSSAPQIIIAKGDNDGNEELAENLPQSLKEQKSLDLNKGIVINNNINVQSSVNVGYNQYPKKYYNYPHYYYKPMPPYYHYYPYPKHYFYYSNSYGTYHKYYYY